VFLGQDVVLVVVEGQGFALAKAVKVGVHVFAALYHQYLFAVVDLGFDDYFAVGGQFVAVDDPGFDFVGFFAVEGDVADCAEVESRVYDLEADEELILIFLVVVFNFLLVVHLFIVGNSLDDLSLLVEDVDGVSGFVAHDVVGNELQRFSLLFPRVLVLLFLCLFFPGCCCFFYAEEYLA
jgi:hypothetical protein